MCGILQELVAKPGSDCREMPLLVKDKEESEEAAAEVIH